MVRVSDSSCAVSASSYWNCRRMKRRLQSADDEIGCTATRTLQSRNWAALEEEVLSRHSGGSLLLTRGEARDAPVGVADTERFRSLPMGWIRLKNRVRKMMDRV